MCLGVPGQVKEFTSVEPVKMGKVDFAGVEREVCFASLPDVEVGDYVLVHVGFALTKLERKTALETLSLFAGMGVFQDELGVQTAPHKDLGKNL
jgi:hydrogenase expression/formation protein HypC